MQSYSPLKLLGFDPWVVVGAFISLTDTSECLLVKWLTFNAIYDNFIVWFSFFDSDPLNVCRFIFYYSFELYSFFTKYSFAGKYLEETIDFEDATSFNEPLMYSLKSIYCWLVLFYLSESFIWEDFQPLFLLFRSIYFGEIYVAPKRVSDLLEGYCDPLKVSTFS